MPEGSSPEVPKAPRLSDMPDARQGINDILAKVNQSKAPQEASAQKPEDTVKQETDMFLGALPPELQESVRGFYRDVAKSIVSQQTSMHGDQAEVRVTPDRVDYYKNRLTEVLDSGFLNPHINPPKKITE